MLMVIFRLTTYFEAGLFSDRLETIMRDSPGPPLEMDDPCESTTVQKDQSVEYADIQYKNVTRLNRYMIILATLSSSILLYELFSHKNFDDTLTGPVNRKEMRKRIKRPRLWWHLMRKNIFIQ